VKQAKKIYILIFPAIFFIQLTTAQPLSHKGNFTRQDTLRGSIGPGRDWWDAIHYTLYVTPDFNKKTITGNVVVHFKWLSKNTTKGFMQIDLQQPMVLDSVLYQNKKLSFNREGNVYFIKWPETSHAEIEEINLYYHGIPQEAKMPPWDGGWIWKKDSKGRPWMTVACQGLGASVWYPCKDHQSDEPDNGATLHVTIPDTLSVVANGTLESRQTNPDGTITWTWNVIDPINIYNIVPYIGKYTHWSDTYTGENIKQLSLDYWVLDYNLEKSKKQFGRDVKRMLEAFEYWFGPYPFYEDGFKLVESSHLGMEHQSAIAYGNHYLDGYLGRDLSGSGWGLKWDYIIVHESGHEWFGNNITTNDIADMWVHEGFTMYSEALFIEYYYGKKAADEYVQGIRNNISNDKPLIGHYGVNQEGSSDMYNKGANMIHTIRQVINNDSIFRSVLRGLNKEFYHKTVNSKEVENYFSKHTGKDFSKIFDQYLRTTSIPILEYKLTADSLSYRWNNCVPGFNMPVKWENEDFWLYPSGNCETMKLPSGLKNSTWTIDRNFYVNLKLISSLK